MKSFFEDLIIFLCKIFLTLLGLGLICLPIILVILLKSIWPGLLYIIYIAFASVVKEVD